MINGMIAGCSDVESKATRNSKIMSRRGSPTRCSILLLVLLVVRLAGRNFLNIKDLKQELAAKELNFSSNLTETSSKTTTGAVPAPAVNHWQRSNIKPPSEHHQALPEYTTDDDQRPNNRANVKHHYQNVSTTPMILLGIESPYTKNAARRLSAHHVIRTSYLDFDRRNDPDQPNPVCPLDKFLTEAMGDGRDDDISFRQHCRLIYTFLITTGITSSENTISLDANVTDHVQRRWKWLQYASSLLSTSNFTDIPVLVAHIEGTGIIHPPTFWNENPLLFDQTAHSFEALYAGTCQIKEDCHGTICTSLRRDTFMRGFVMLSTDLVHQISSQAIPEISPSDSPDVAIANALHNHSGQFIQQIEVKGVETLFGASTDVFLRHWENYRDSIVNYTDPVETAHTTRKHPTLLSKNNKRRSVRFLFGIFTMDSSAELERRNAIRETYLSAFVNSSTPHRICSFYELDTFMEDDEFVCEIAYVFVTGGNPDGPTELLEETESSGPIALREVPESVRLPDHDKHDIVYLNIKENMEDGKTPTYFKYATLMVDEHYFDYIAKVDGDTLVNVHVLVDASQQQEQEQQHQQFPLFPQNIRIYGGCVFNIPKRLISKMIGPGYALGAFYFMSPDMARYITSRECPLHQVDIGFEDASMSNFVYSHPRHIQHVSVTRKVCYHPLKNVTSFRAKWKELTKDDR